MTTSACTFETAWEGMPPSPLRTIVLYLKNLKENTHIQLFPASTEQKQCSKKQYKPKKE